MRKKLFQIIEVADGTSRASAVYDYTMMAVILLSLLPLTSKTPGAFLQMMDHLAAGIFILDYLLRLLRTFRVFRALKMARYSKSIRIIKSVIWRQRTPLLAVCTLAVAYTMVCALVIFNVEPQTFDNFFEAVYWATVSLTTMGYGDIYPVTNVGRAVTMLSSLVGIAIIALPSGIITAGYMDELQRERESEKDAQKIQ